MPLVAVAVGDAEVAGEGQQAAANPREIRRVARATQAKRDR